MLNNFVCTLIGGLLAILGSAITQHYQWKKEKTLWLHEKRLDLYTDLISLLDSIEIRVQPIYDESCSAVELETEVEYVETKLDELLQFMKSNNGKLLLFLPEGVNTDLVKLSGAIYAIIANEEKQQIDSMNFKKSEIYQVMEQAKTISAKLKREFDI